ncbi:MAG: putative enzyme related to lactoylglutathione lyase [Rhizobium sp.]|nr:putative enzyme related to lactoylglutathione lyase [Rhizobium sp.]
MAVLRIVADIATPDPKAAKAFYGDILGLDLVMDHGWIVTYAGAGTMVPQISFANQGGSGTPVPDLSIEVDNVDEIYGLAKTAGYEITYPITDEEWGVRRFYVRDPFGKVVNILSHAD